MRRTRVRGRTLLVIMLALVGGGVATPAAVAVPPVVGDITLQVTPKVTQGEPGTVAVWTTSVTDLYAYDFTIEFDPALLELDADSAVAPEGGYAALTPDEGSVTLSYTRLGTSPGLDGGPIQLGEMTFTALAGGDATLALASASMISSTMEAVALTDVAEATASLTPLPPTDPEPEPTGGPMPIAAPAPSEPPAPASQEGATPAPASDGDRDGGSLAITGTDAALWLSLAAVLLAVGTLLVIHRRRAVAE